MSYSRKIRGEARSLWLMGLSDRSIRDRLEVLFPNEPTPKKHQTIIEWRKAEGWEKDLEIIKRKADQKRTEEIANEISKMNDRHIGLLTQYEAHILFFLRRMVVDENKKPIDTALESTELVRVGSALETSIKNQRLIKNLPTSSQKIEVDWRKEAENLGVNPDELLRAVVESINAVTTGDDSVNG